MGISSFHLGILSLPVEEMEETITRFSFLSIDRAFFTYLDICVR